MSRSPSPPPMQPFVQINLEINSDMKSALHRPPFHKNNFFLPGLRQN
jgi:hypothetical protein